jgi:undecaprenyl-diphosphatase
MARDSALTGIAQALGAHALALFAFGFVVLLAGTAAFVWTLRRYGPASGHRRWSAVAVLASRFGLGFALIVVAAALFAAIAGEIGAGERLGALDHVFSAAVRDATSPAMRSVFAWVTHLGDPATLTGLCVAVAIVLLLRGERLLAAGWVMAIGGNAILNVTLKHVFERVRPVHGNGLPLADGFSFPSGHSSGSLVAYGMLAYLAIRTLPRAWQMPVVLAAVAVAYVTGCSRVFLQMHYATDVIAGFASGAAWLAISIASLEATRLLRARRR